MWTYGRLLLHLWNDEQNLDSLHENLDSLHEECPDFPLEKACVMAVSTRSSPGMQVSSSIQKLSGSSRGVGVLALTSD